MIARLRTLTAWAAFLTLPPVALVVLFWPGVAR